MPCLGKEYSENLSTDETLNVPATKLQRSSGSVRLSFKRYGLRTVLGTLYQDGCYKSRFPRTNVQKPAEAILINTSGGLTDGDNLSCFAAWDSSTAALITTQAAERIYRSRDVAAIVHSELSIGECATACWLPQETILFDGGCLDRTTVVDMAPGSRLFAAESIVFGRANMGEVCQTGRLFDRWRIRIDGRLVFADSVLFDDSCHGLLAEQLGHRPIANGANCMATLIYAGADCAEQLDKVRAALDRSNVVAGASNLGPLIVARVMADSSLAMRNAVAHVFESIQGDSVERQFELPRVWHC